MSIPLELVAQLEAFAELHPLPPVRALHLPADPEPGSDRGEFCALELEDGSLGLGYVLLDGALEALRDAPSQAGADALALVRRWADPGSPGAVRTLGLAAANALTRCLLDRAGFVPPPATDSVGLVAARPGERIGMIGHFGPLIPRLVAAGAELVVVELRPELVGTHAGWRVTLDPAELAGCRQVLATGTMLLNDSLERMLAHCRGAEVFALVGPTVGCLPDALFARGVTQIGGSWVTDPAGFVASLAAGALRSPHARKFTLTRNGWPGFEALMARLQRR